MSRDETTPRPQQQLEQSNGAPNAAAASESRPSLSSEQLELFRQSLALHTQAEVRFDDLSRALYSTDASVYQIVPAGVVVPRSREDVIQTVRICREFGCPITARGGGTSQAGQAIGHGVQIDFSKQLNRVLVLNPGEAWVRVEPGIVVDDLNATLKPYGLNLPLDISTSDRATIGGMIGNNSSGTRSVIYGKTLDYVLELVVVLSDGSVVELRPLGEPEVVVRCEQQDLEGSCYRVVRRLAHDHAAEIDRRYPKILRRVGGYNLDEFVAARQPPKQFNGSAVQQFDLSRLLVGSEGTLALVLDAKLRLVPLPPARAVAVVHFHELLEALAATPLILRHGPSAVELVDRFILESTRGRPAFEPLRHFIAGDPAAVLIVELFEQSPGDLPGRVTRLEEALRAAGLGYHVHRAVDAAEQARIWRLRRAALGLSMSERGDAKALSFVEDTAVAPDRLRDYIERFQKILATHDTQAGFYAHASVGLLHVRPIVNLKTADGVEKFRRIAEAIAELVLEFGGALSGEHGDGLVRSPFQVKMYGPELYDAFCAIKRTFDPAGIFNPGKIVHAPPLTEHLRFGAGYETRELPTTLDFSDFGGLQRATEQCSGVGECRKTLAGTMCPSYMATREETDSTRGRANVLRLAITQPGTLQLGDAAVHRVLDLCLECRACKSECPTGVDMARLKAEFLHQHHQRHGVPLRARLLSRPDRLGRWGCRLFPVSNWLARSRLARWFAEKLFGLSRFRTPPAFARRTFQSFWNARQRGDMGRRFDASAASGATSERPTVIFFNDTFTNYFDPQIGCAAVGLLEAAGFRVELAPHVCCGRPLISQGLLDAAQELAETNAQRLFAAAERGQPIIFCEPSCLSAMREDVPLLLRGELRRKAEAVAGSCMLFEESLDRELSAGRARLEFEPGPARVLLHGHCHQKAMGLVAPAVSLLARIPRCSVTEPDAGCCGMAGSFGYLREHYDVSWRIAERRLLPAVRACSSDTAIVAAGTSCRRQLEDFAGVTVLHPAELLRLQMPLVDANPFW